MDPRGEGAGGRSGGLENRALTPGSARDPGLAAEENRRSRKQQHQEDEPHVHGIAEHGSSLRVGEPPERTTRNSNAIAGISPGPPAAALENTTHARQCTNLNGAPLPR